MSFSFKEQLARRVPVQALDRVPSGLPAVLALRPSATLSDVKSVAASLSLARRGTTLSKAKRAIEEAIDTGRAVIDLSTVEDVDVLVGELRGSGILARRMGAGPVDVRAVRQGLGLTQEQFALRYGFDLGTLQSWEIGKRKPPTAVASYLTVIRRMPERASEALEAGE